MVTENFFAPMSVLSNVGFNADSKGNIISIDAKQPKTFADQMLEYSKLILTFKKHLITNRIPINRRKPSNFVITFIKFFCEFLYLSGKKKIIAIIKATRKKSQINCP
jgi:hypothetical protein